ncbi:long-chain-fatty-acid--CoA ligase [Usitatibacter palustris]|uniref:Long-chain-fatty-acid--CoA ligase n=1 Tax=Usitatibacter palustris TaxID=2732487 RepID=A0A6M4H6C4_9PROT|nr:long-chain-fatty-acid--CoA ligase [Usitatibacter palustris]QJR15181.1 Long-chain-fatty-acid--CoA ligase [Usitatibacter palustris]
MEKVWLKSYPPGVPAEIDVREYASIRDIFEKSCAKFASLPAYSCMGRTITYAELERQSRDFGAWLQARGLEKGDRIAIMMPNVLQYPVALFGALRAGFTVVNCNPLYTPRELEHQLVDSGAKAIVILENFAKTLEAVLPKTPVKTIVTTQLGDMHGFPKSLIMNFVVKRVKKMVPEWNLPGTVTFPAVLSAGAGLKLAEPPLNHGDIAFLQYTGGTTGVSKGAMLTHGNIVANLLQTSAWWGVGLREGREIIITALPLYHIFALTGNCLTFMKIGAHNVLITNPRDFAGFVKELGTWRFTCFTGVNSLFNALLNTPGFDKLDFSGLHMSLGGGMAVQRAVAERWKQVTGKPLLEAYGLTETSPGACINPMVDGAEYNGYCGLPISSTTVTIRDDDGKILALGETGEICIAGPQVMKGYWNRPEETAKVMTSDGSFRTGDIGIMNSEGFVKIVDRKKDMILVSGFNVYPNEVEDVVAMMPGVLEVCAVATPDDKSGEVVRAVIVRKDPALTRDQVIEHCKQNLTGYKVPKVVEFWKELPKTNVGKVLRREVKNAPLRV